MRRLTQVFIDDKYYDALYLTGDEHDFLVAQLLAYRTERGLPPIHTGDLAVGVR